MRNTLLLTLCLLAACGGGDDDGGGDDGDGGAGTDASPGSGPDAAPAGGAVVLDYRGETAQLPLAYMGYVRSGETITQLYFELSNMEEPGCPSKTSPIPPQLMTISGFPGGEPATHTYEDGVRSSFFDFDGRLRDEIEPDSATAATVTVTALDVETGVASATVDITFGANGTAEGSLVASHCDSLDTAD